MLRSPLVLNLLNKLTSLVSVLLRRWIVRADKKAILSQRVQL
jgi:hypothetical protein